MSRPSQTLSFCPAPKSSFTTHHGPSFTDLLAPSDDYSTGKCAEMRHACCIVTSTRLRSDWAALPITTQSMDKDKNMAAEKANTCSCPLRAGVLKDCLPDLRASVERGRTKCVSRVDHIWLAFQRKRQYSRTNKLCTLAHKSTLGIRTRQKDFSPHAIPAAPAGSSSGPSTCPPSGRRRAVAEAPHGRPCPSSRAPCEIVAVRCEAVRECKPCARNGRERLQVMRHKYANFSS